MSNFLDMITSPAHAAADLLGGSGVGYHGIMGGGQFDMASDEQESEDDMALSKVKKHVDTQQSRSRGRGRGGRRRGKGGRGPAGLQRKSTMGSFQRR